MGGPSLTFRCPGIRGLPKCEHWSLREDVKSIDYIDCPMRRACFQANSTFVFDNEVPFERGC